MINQLKILKYFLLVLIVGVCLYGYNTIQNLQEENKRQTENLSQIRKAGENLMYQQNLTTKELEEYIEYKNKKLQEDLKKSKINLNKVLSVVSVWHHARDTLVKEIRVDTVLVAIKENRSVQQSFVDTSSCFKIKGKIIYDKEKLSLLIEEKNYKTKIDGVAYYRNREWSFLGFKTRFLGKKEITAKVFDSCGNSKILEIRKQD